MSQQDINIHKLSNGMTLVAESMRDVSSGAFVFLVPGGVVYDPANQTGTASVISEMLFRGAGDMNNRTLNEKLDGLGLQRYSNVTTLHSSFGGALIADNLLETLRLYSEILIRPTFAEEQFAPCLNLTMQFLI